MWLDYLESLQNYLEKNDLIDQGYAYIWNEPQKYFYFLIKIIIILYLALQIMMLWYLHNIIYMK